MRIMAIVLWLLVTVLSIVVEKVGVGVILRPGVTVMAVSDCRTSEDGEGVIVDMESSRRDSVGVSVGV